MKLFNLMIPFLIIGCTRTLTDSREYKLLGELKNNKRQLIKKAESGWIPGEDIWLRITRYDTMGNVIEEYGAKPYGDKYKDTFKYDNQNRVIEKCEYSFSGEFENYGPKEGYELKDTLVDFRATDSQLDYKVLYSFDIKNEMTREYHYKIDFDSVTNEKKSFLNFDTSYRSIKADSTNTKKQ